MLIRPRHSGWTEMQVWFARYRVEKRRIAPYCGDQLMAAALYTDWYANGVAKTKRGRVPW